MLRMKPQKKIAFHFERLVAELKRKRMIKLIQRLNETKFYAAGIKAFLYSQGGGLRKPKQLYVNL